MKTKVKQGWFRLSVVISLILLAILICGTIVIIPDEKIIYTKWYEDIFSCNNKGNNSRNTSLYGSAEYIYAQKNSDYYRLIKLVENNMMKNKNYFEKQCHLDNISICKNVFDKFDYPYFYEEINKKYMEKIAILQEEKNTIYFIAILIYIAYLILLLSIWWILLGFFNDRQNT